MFFYPSITTHTAGYIESKIRLEFGARGGIEPIEHREIASYIAETFPDLFDKPKCLVHTLAAQRTFWEKATILHALHHGAKMNDRMSRHYYDMFMMATNGMADKALQDKDLLSKVVENNKVMFHDNKASYETAAIGSLRLIPDEHKKEILKKDYISMNEMFFGNPPDFEIMMSELSRLEQHINGSQDDAYLAKLVAERQNEESFEVDINDL